MVKAEMMSSDGIASKCSPGLPHLELHLWALARTDGPEEQRALGSGGGGSGEAGVGGGAEKLWQLPGELRAKSAAEPSFSSTPVSRV